MAAVQLDTPQLASYCSLPQTSIRSLLDTPTAELVRTLLENISVKAREHNDLASEKLKLGVEYENAIRGGESKTRILKASVNKSQQEADGLRRKLELQETARESAENELDRLKSATSTSTSELSSLKVRIDSLESSNRDTLSLLDSKTTAYDDLAQELKAQHQKTVDLRQNSSSLEQSLESANAASSRAKYHEQALQQEVEQLNRSNDWLDKELKTKSEEHTKYRKEKVARIAELQRQCEEASSTIDTLRRSENTVRRRLDELYQKNDERLQKIQTLEEVASKRDENFRVELDAANRLAKLRENAAKIEKERQEELTAQLESTKESASIELGRLSAELETEHMEKNAAEARSAELEVQVEELQVKVSSIKTQERDSIGPNDGVNGFTVHTPIRGNATPNTSTPGSRVKGNLSMTQLYSNYNNSKRELEAEKRRNETLSATIDDMMQEMEDAKPTIEELHADHARLETEVTSLSVLVDSISKERDQAIKSSKKREGLVEVKVKEGELLRQQLRDLSCQVKLLLMEAHLRDQSQNDMSIEGRAHLEALAHGDVDGEQAEGVTDTDKYISKNLVGFRNLIELQEQNTNLLKITREIGERMESEEALRKKTDIARNWEDLEQKYERCKEEIKSLVTQSQSYIRERDMFRRLLSHRDQLPSGTDADSMHGDFVNGNRPPATPSQADVMHSIEDSPASRDMADYAKLLKDMQVHFDSYRQEAATDRSTLKDQVDNLSKTNSELRSEIVRSNSQVTLAHERYEMLQANYEMLKNENTELQKRSQTLCDSAAKQDLRVQQVAEDLVEAKGLIDSMRNETANLKAEKDFWKTIERRLNEDNKNLLDERSRLNSLNNNLQNLLNVRERSDHDAQRKLQTEVDVLEKELQTTKAKLSEQSDESRRCSLRREYDHEQSQKRIDDLVSSLGATREELAAAKTARDHLSTRIEELTIQLRSAEERLIVLQSTSASHAQSSQPTDSNKNSSNGEQSSATKEQQLEVQVSELKRDLDLARAELDNVNDQVEQYKAISQSSEEELVSLNQTHDLYRQETDKFLEAKDSRIKNLEQRIEDSTKELAVTNSELSGLQNAQSENDRRLNDQRKAFEAEFAQLKDQDDRHAAAAQYYQEDLKVQAQIAQQAQKNYEDELVKHADAAKALQKVRSEQNELKIEIVEAKTEAESTRATLRQDEESWSSSKERFEREIADLRAARQDLKSQNNHLHQQLEGLTNLHRRTPNVEGPSHEEPPSTGLESLQEVIKYLRREKEIVDVQFELSAQEAKRLKQQLDYTQSQLDDTRLKLNQQRRVEADSERSALDHNKLMETINDLNTHRESNVTLRAEGRQAQLALATKTKEAEELQVFMGPLHAEVRELKSERENQEGEIKLLKENCDRWQQRAQNVLQKYDRIDPAEMDELKDRLKALEVERNALASAKQSLQEQIENSATQMAQAQEQSNERVETMKARLTEQFKGRSKVLSDRLKEKDAALQSAVNDRSGLEAQLAAHEQLKSALAMARSERDAAVEKVGKSKAGAESSAQMESEEGELDEGSSTVHSSQANLQSMQEKVDAAETRASGEASESTRLRNELTISDSKISSLEAKIEQLQNSLDATILELTQLRATVQQPDETRNSSDVEEQTQKLRNDLAQAQRDVENLRTSASVNASLLRVPAEDGSKSLVEQVAEHAEAVREELEARHEDRVKINDDNFQKRTDAMKAQLNRKLTESKTQIRQSLIAEHDKAVQALKSGHEQVIKDLQNRHKDELVELQRSKDSGLAELKAEWEKEKQTHGTNVESNISAKHEAPSDGPYQPSVEEAKALVSTNEVVRSVLRKNVTQQLAKAREEHEQALAAQLADAQGKANTAKDHAVMLEGKKTALQVNMANNKAKILQCKLDIVQKAAQVTPDKPVLEVWTAAKDAKPAQSTNIQQQQPSAQGQGQVASTSSQIAPSSNSPKTTSPATQFKPGQSTAPRQPSGVATFGRPTPMQTGPPASDQSSPQVATSQPVSDTSNTPDLPQPHTAGFQVKGPSAPQRPQGTFNPQPTLGTGPAALRGLSSGLPVARGGSVRGNFNTRGRGPGLGRGSQQIDTSRAQVQQQGPGSPSSANLNPSARQFVPGNNKRAREDGIDGHQAGEGGNGKRIRGVGRGS